MANKKPSNVSTVALVGGSVRTSKIPDLPTVTTYLKLVFFPPKRKKKPAVNCSDIDVEDKQH